MRPELDPELKSGEKFMKKAERTLCWNKRDEFWQCLRIHKEDATQCQPSRAAFEQNCPATWVGHFDRKFQYEKFKDKLYKQGPEVMDQKHGVKG